MGNQPKIGTSIHRIENTLHYFLLNSALVR